MWNFVLSWLILAVVTVYVEGVTPARYMVNYCSSTIYVNSSLVLKLTDQPVESRLDVGYLHCDTNIITDPHSYIYLHFLVLDIAHEATTPDRFHIYDFNDDGVKVQVTPTKGIYGVFEKPYYTTNTVDMPIRDYKSSGNKLKLDFLGIPTYMYNGFTVLLTSVKDSSYDECSKGYFYCHNEGMCIPGELRCDADSNCGALDSSDELGCPELEETVTNLLGDYTVFHAVIAAVVGIIVFLVFVILMVVFIKKYNRRKYPLTKARAFLRGGVCTLSTNLDMERLYAPPSYEDVMAGSSQGHIIAGSSKGRGNDPPPDYCEYVRSTLAGKRHEFTDSDTEEDERSANINNEFIDLHPPKVYTKKCKGKGGTPKRSTSRPSVHTAQCHNLPCAQDNLDVPSTSTSVNFPTNHSTVGNSPGRTNSPSSDSSASIGLTGTCDSETEMKSGDSGIEHSRERIPKVAQKVPESVQNNETISLH